MTKPPYLWKAAAAGFSALVVSVVYEALKELSFGSLTRWQSHTITILYCGTVVFVLTAFFLRREQAKLDASIGLSESLMESLPGVVCVLEDSVIRWKMKPVVVESAVLAMQALQSSLNSRERLPLVLTDAHMPEIDGFGLVEMIRRDPLLADLQIVILTSGGERGDMARCRNLGVTAYLTKPFDRLELHEVLLRALCGTPALQNKHSALTRYILLDQTQSLSFLVAEDNIVNQKLISRLLEKKGHQVVLVMNGREALKALETQPFDMVLMDGEMPEMDGLEATRQIREKEKISGAHLPNIALTAYAMHGDKDRFIAAGMDGYVSKPIKLEELFSVIGDMLLRVPKSETEKPHSR